MGRCACRACVCRVRAYLGRCRAWRRARVLALGCRAVFRGCTRSGMCSLSPTRRVPPFYQFIRDMSCCMCMLAGRTMRWKLGRWCLTINPPSAVVAARLRSWVPLESLKAARIYAPTRTCSILGFGTFLPRGARVCDGPAFGSDAPVCRMDMKQRFVLACYSRFLACLDGGCGTASRCFAWRRCAWV